jgi:predicted transcriptional regulator
MKNSGGKKPRSMQTEALRVWKRLHRNRPMTTISIRIPEDVIDDLKDIAPALGYSGYQPLIRAYIGRGLRKDLEKLDRSPGQALAESLRKRGMSDSTIAEVIAEAKVG